eukprot:5909747-Pyramimonas_sp.AAC.1
MSYTQWLIRALHTGHSRLAFHTARVHSAHITMCLHGITSESFGADKHTTHCVAALLLAPSSAPRAPPHPADAAALDAPPCSLPRRRLPPLLPPAPWL